MACWVAPSRRNAAPGPLAWRRQGSFGQFAMIPIETLLISHLAGKWPSGCWPAAPCSSCRWPWCARARAAGGGWGRAFWRLARGLWLPQLPAADAGLLCLWLPGRVHRRAHAQLSARQGAGHRGLYRRADVDRPVQHLRYPMRRACWASASPLPALGHLRPARRPLSRSS